MKKPSIHWLLALGLALLAGCSPSSSSDRGSAQLAVLLPRAGASSISRLSVTASAADMPSASVELSPTHGPHGGSLGNLPTGSNRSFLAQAFDASGKRLFQGSAPGVSISAGQTPLVAIALQEDNPPSAYLNGSPVIDSLVASSISVATGGSVSLQATAHGVHPDEPLSYAWSSTAGSFSPAAEASTTWTAPASSGTHTLTVTVTDSGGLSSSASVDITVLSSEGQGAAQVTVSFNSTPRVSSLTATASQLGVGQTTSVSASASDPDGDSLSYDWSASCAGTWAQVSSSSALFTPSELPAGTCNNCELTVSVSDGRGGQTLGTVALCVGTTPVPQHIHPVVIRTFSSVPPEEPISGGRVLTYEVAASDPEGSALSFSWAANTGSTGTAASTASQSRITWTAPSCVNEGITATITATVTNAFNLTATHSFVMRGLSICRVSAWSSTEAMTSARYKHTATSLNNGMVLVTGGQDAPAKTEVYDQSSGTWSSAGLMSSARHSHTATLHTSTNRQMLVAGGINPAGPTGSVTLATAEVYDLDLGTWKTISPMRFARYLHTATRLPNGKVLVTGGYNSGYLKTAEVYDPISKLWTTTNPMSAARSNHTATLLNNGKVLVTGGKSSSTTTQQTAELYDPGTGLWSSTGLMTSARANHTATLLPDGRVLLTGGTKGSNTLDTAELYDPNSGTSGTWSSAGTLSAQRANHTATLLNNGKVLIAGGLNLDNGYLRTAELYEPASGTSGTWSSASTMNSSRGNHTATLLPNGKVLVSGGYSNNTSLVAAELYTP